MKVRFSASGFGSKMIKFSCRRDIMQDAYNTAIECDGTVQDFEDEVVVNSKNGEEIARWELM